MKITPSEGFTSSSYVFTGEVTDIDKNDATSFRGLEVTLKVEKVWKGEPKEIIKVHTAGSTAACGYPFKKGETYLVYAVSDEADPIRVSLCSRTAPVGRAKEDLDSLGKPAHTFDRKRRGCTASPDGTTPFHLASSWLMVLALLGAARRLTRTAP